MAKKPPSSKQLQIDKAQANIVVVIAVATFITVFSLVTIKALLSQRSYQSRVITEKKKALTQLKANNAAAAQLVDSYKVFVSAPENIIGGSSGGTGERDGDNAKIVLDALPSKYDFPALASSLDKILTNTNYSETSIAGDDDEIEQSKEVKVEPVDMPFTMGATGNTDSIQSLIDILDRSIRPMVISTINIEGTDDNLSITIEAKSYYQPQKTVNVTTKVVK